LKKILYFISHPIQYQTPLFQLIAKEKDFDFTVCYLTSHTIGGVDSQFGQKIEWNIPLLEGYKYVFLKNYAFKPGVSGSFWGLINWGVIRHLVKEKPDYIIVHGWAYFTNYLVLLWAKVLGIPTIIRGESPLKQESYNKLKKTLLNHFIHKALYIGKQNKEFYKYYGLKEPQLFYGPYCVDNSRFSSDYEKLKPAREEVRRSLGILESDIVILFLGKYIAKKRPVDLVRAFKSLKEPNIRLIMVGEGEMRKELEEYIAKHNLNTRVKLTGFVNQAEISRYYVASDIFVLPSGVGETWGLVLNEAMNFNLPIIVSDMVGSSDDLVHDGVNGFTYPCGDQNSLRDKIEILINDNNLRSKMGVQSGRIIKDYNYSKIIDGLKKAIN